MLTPRGRCIIEAEQQETGVRSVYEDRIVEDPEIHFGKPTVRGTRVSVEVVLAHLSQNLDAQDLLAAYPRLTLEDVKACVEYADTHLRARSGRRRRDPRERARGAS